MILNKSKLKKNGFIVFNTRNVEILKFCQNIIKKNISSKNFKNDSKFFNEVLKTQNEFYKKRVHIDFIRLNQKKIKKILNIKNLKNELSITSFLHLRVVRPSTKVDENIGLHRESFYNNDGYVKDQINITVPLLNYSKDNSMKVIDGSHKVPDKKIKTLKLSSKESGIKKGSIRHRLGSPYNPKKIISGVSIAKAKRLNLSLGKLCLFSAYLIHGGGTNKTKKVRYSLDFAIIKNKNLNSHRVKKQFNSYSDKKYYFTNFK